jgi:hypothetical protein
MALRLYYGSKAFYMHFTTVFRQDSNLLRFSARLEEVGCFRLLQQMEDAPQSTVVSVGTRKIADGKQVSM